MFCPSCTKLAYLHTNKPCIRCQAVVLNNISILCDFCSKTEKVCSVCLKKTDNSFKKSAQGGCGPCRGK